MSKVMTALSVSVDGYITGREPGAGHGLGDATVLFDWYVAGDTPSRVFDGFRLSAASRSVFDAAAARVGASLAGRNTYDDSGWGDGGTPHPDAPLVVLSHRPLPAEHDRQTLVTTGIEDAVATARELAGDKDVALMGGGVVTAALAAGLVDEVILHQVPILLGGGRPFFQPLARHIDLRLVEAVPAPGVTHLHYEVLQEGRRAVDDARPARQRRAARRPAHRQHLGPAHGPGVTVQRDPALHQLGPARRATAHGARRGRRRHLLRRRCRACDRPAHHRTGPAASSYVPGSTPLVWPRLRSLRSGSVVFTVPPEPASCGPTALKPLLMACDHWRREKVLADLSIRLVLPGAAATEIPEADRFLERAFDGYGVEVLRDARIEQVDWEAHSLTIATPTGRRVLEEVGFAHAVPHYRAPQWIAEAGLAVDPAPGLVDVDAETLRSRRHGSIWALGDAAALDTRPSGGALRRQVDVLAENLAATSIGEPLRRYDGYTVVPITVSRRKLLLAEVDRDNRIDQSVPIVDLTKPRRVARFVDRHLLPQLYWRRILQGKV